MLKLQRYTPIGGERIQPPSGGCVLKQFRAVGEVIEHDPAAFGRLCVETYGSIASTLIDEPAAFGRLCVETALSK